MVEHACSKLGRAAARRNAPKQPRVNRAGMREQKNWGPNTGGLSDFSTYRGFIRFFSTYQEFIGFSSKYRGFIGFFT